MNRASHGEDGIQTKSRHVSNSGPESVQLGANRFGIVSRLADDLAHEIKNPLHSMVINLEVLRRRIETGAKDAALERADVLEHEIHRLHALVERLLVLLRPSRSAEPFSNVSDVLADVVPLIEMRARLANMDFACHPVGDVLAGISAEGLRFALLNVLDTAFDGAAHGALEMAGQVSSKEVHLEIRCSGSIPPQSGDARLTAAAALVEETGGRIEMQELAGEVAIRKVLLVIPRASAIHLDINKTP